jgi:very-short-patch-repair endonuclease
MITSSPLTYARARRMRAEPTAGEKRLWGALRNRRLGGLKFCRQVTVGPYIVDFINRAFGVVIEVDGATHGEDAEIARDQRRTAFLESRGLLVHRITNHGLFEDLGAVLDGIYAVVSERATKGPHQSLRDSFSTEVEKRQFLLHNVERGNREAVGEVPKNPSSPRLRAGGVRRSR